MTDYWWYREGGFGGNANWDSQSSPPNYDNWWLNSEHSTPSTTLPGAGDKVYFDGAIAPATGPASQITLYDLESINLTANITGSTVSQNLRVGTSKRIRWGRPDYRHDWYGTLDNLVDAKFWGNSSTIIGGALISCNDIDFYGELTVMVAGGTGDGWRFHDKVNFGGGYLHTPAYFLGTNKITSAAASVTLYGGTDPNMHIRGNLEIEKGANSLDVTENVVLKFLNRRTFVKFTGSVDFGTGDRPTLEFALDEQIA